MEEFFKKIPKPLLAVLVIILGIAIVFVIQPPKSICDTEMVAFQESLVGALYSSNAGKKKGNLPGEIRRAKEQCKFGNSSGACYEYFRVLRKMASGMDRLTPECLPTIVDAPGVKSSLLEGFTLMTQIAWGEELPESQAQAWFTSSEMVTYCYVKEALKKSMAENEWAELNSQIMRTLPGRRLPSADPSFRQRPLLASLTMTEDQIYPLTLLSVRCELYL